MMLVSRLIVNHIKNGTILIGNNKNINNINYINNGKYIIKESRRTIEENSFGFN